MEELRELRITISSTGNIVAGRESSTCAATNRISFSGLSRSEQREGEMGILVSRKAAGHLAAVAGRSRTRPIPIPSISITSPSSETSTTRARRW
jgi:hypothetical protein